MARLVMKFGGTSMGGIERMRNVAAHVKREYDAGHDIAVVVSAMAGETDRLAGLARAAASMHDAREYDAIVSTGEQVSAGLLAIILQDIGVPARSWTGWQVAVTTSSVHGAARITGVEVDKLKARFADAQVCVITGFQGLSAEGRIATLGRGGSDTSAVAVAAAIGADCCDIYTDVDGVYTADPRIVPGARKLDKISYEEMLEMASQGAKVLQTRSVELAMVHGVRLRVRSTFAPPDATPSDVPDFNLDIGTLVCDEDEIVESQVVSGIAYAKDEAKVTLVKVADKPGVAARVFVPLADAGINVDMIVQNVSEDGQSTDMTFTVPTGDLERALATLRDVRDDIGYQDLTGSTNIVKVSVIGIGMRSHAGVASQMFQALASKGINILAITTSEIKVSVLIEADYAELALRTLHTAYGLDEDQGPR
ncbi:Aspartokinase [hydrothermal vent metagenome]|uniref:aspartate kinase n=1 Tax=hydrothermal vent metagenome TaxID=652676 RepID=A0A3B0T8C6_9ZZZZ